MKKENKLNDLIIKLNNKMTKKDKLKLLIIRLKENKEEDKKKAFEFIKQIRDGRYN